MTDNHTTTTMKCATAPTNQASNHRQHEHDQDALEKNTTSLDHYLNNFDRPCFTAACFRHSTLRGCFKSVCQSSCTRCMPSLLPARAEVHHAPVEQGRGAWKTAANVHTASAARITESKRLGAKAANQTKSRAPGRPQPPPSSSSLPFLFLQPPLATNAILQSPNHVDTLTTSHDD